jgi:hypothetical protein
MKLLISVVLKRRTTGEDDYFCEVIDIEDRDPANEVCRWVNDRMKTYHKSTTDQLSWFRGVEVVSLSQTYLPN